MASPIPQSGPPSSFNPLRNFQSSSIEAKGYALLTLLIGDMQGDTVEPPYIAHSAQITNIEALYTDLKSKGAPQEVLESLEHLINSIKQQGNISVKSLKIITNYLEKTLSPSQFTQQELTQIACGKLQQAYDAIMMVYWNGGDQQRLNRALQLLEQGATYSQEANLPIASEIMQEYNNLKTLNDQGTLLPTLFNDPTYSIANTLEKFIWQTQSSPNFSDPWYPQHP